MKRILIADDHELLRRGLRGLLLEHFPGLEIGEAATAPETLQAVHEGTWEVLLLDIHLPGRSGLDILGDLRRSHPGLPVIVLSAFPEEEYAVRAYRLGAAAFLSKSGPASELVAALRKAAAGGRYVPPRLAERLAAAVAGAEPDEPHHALSERELHVLRLVAQGKTLKAIAAELALSERTIGTYRTRISRKMGLGSNVELTRYAVQHGLVD